MITYQLCNLNTQLHRNKFLHSFLNQGFYILNGFYSLINFQHIFLNIDYLHRIMSLCLKVYILNYFYSNRIYFTQKKSFCYKKCK